MENRITIQHCGEKLVIDKWELRGNHAKVVTDHLNVMIQRQMNAVIYARPMSCRTEVTVIGDDIFSRSLEITIKSQLYDCERLLPKEGETKYVGQNESAGGSKEKAG